MTIDVSLNVNVHFPQMEKIHLKLGVLMATLDTLIDSVRSQGSQLDSLNTFVQGLYDQIKQLQLNQADQAKIDELFASVQANDQKLADAFTENTPPAPEPEPQV